MSEGDDYDNDDSGMEAAEKVPPNKKRISRWSPQFRKRSRSLEDLTSLNA